MINNRIAVVGDKDIITAFKAIGMEIFPANNGKEAEEVIKKIAKNFAIIYVTENVAQEADEFLTKYKTKTYPAVIPLPQSKDGYGITGIKRDVERAVGTDILFNKED